MGRHKGAVCKTVAIRVGLEDAKGQIATQAQRLIVLRALR